MLLFYTHTVTPRLQYICDFLLGEMMGIEYQFTNDEASFITHYTAGINYTTKPLASGFHIAPATLLFEKNITSEQINCFTSNNDKAFFETAGAHFSFDIFAASFYLLSRYEEYRPHKKDIYGRYSHENSLAFKEDFLQLPLVNKWINQLAKALLQQFPALIVKLPQFRFQPTYDIDMAYSYKHKGFVRNAGGFLKEPSLERINVLLGKENDPFDVYDWLDALNATNNLTPVYFFLLAEKNGLYDKNVLPSIPAMQQLIVDHAKKYTIGIHPSWQSGDDEDLLLSEKIKLEEITNNAITFSRQHYLRFTLPQGYRRLTDAGVTDDFSMGYGTVNGFRASVASSFFWYDLEKEAATPLRIHPFCFMDSNSYYKQGATPANAFEEISKLSNECKSVNGTFISIWHNQFFGTNPAFIGWRQVYERFIAQL